MVSTTIPKIKANRLWTYDEMVAELPETNRPTELWNGEIIISPSPRPSHQQVVMAVSRLLDDYVRRHKLGKVFISPLDVVFSPHRVVQPDVFFISKKNQSIIRVRIDGAPDLTVEVISEGTWRRDRIDKKALYEQFGVSEYWIIDPGAEIIEVFALVKGVY